MTMTRDIAGITAALQRLLEGFLPKVDLAGTPAAIGVSALPPDRIGLTPEHNGLNLYLYRITTSSAQRNAAPPRRNRDIDVTAIDAVSVDLHYMLTAYCVNDLYGQTLLGAGAMALHQTPVLASQGDPVRLTIQMMPTEEMSLLWQMFGEKYRPSIPFTATGLVLRAADAAPVVTPSP